MKRIMLGLIVVTLAGADCPSGQTVVSARDQCPSLTDAEFGTFLSAIQVDMQNGFTKAEELRLIPGICSAPGVVFDTVSECEACLRAIVAEVYGP